MCSKLVTHPVHYFMGNRSCVCHSTPPPSGKICNHYRFINITPRVVFVKAQVAVCVMIMLRFVLCKLREKTIKKDGPKPVLGLQIWWAIEELNF